MTRPGLPTAIMRGLRVDSMLGYLKAIGILRLLANGFDKNVGLRWIDDHAEFIEISRDDIIRFFLDRYRPTPIINPWNSGAGFDSKSSKVEAGRTLARISATSDERWLAYRNAIDVARAVVAAVDLASGSVLKPEDRKQHILLGLRRRYSDLGIEWLDAAVLVGRDRPRFPPLLGSGGNDGRLDFSVNFMQRALDVAGPDPATARADWLADSLDGIGSARLPINTAIGQYSLAAAGGPNASTGFEGDSLVNPWDLIFAIEGTIAFAGSVVKRFGTARSSAAPFTFAAVGAGYASASEGEVSRGEIWLPRWKGVARYAAVRSLLRSGRVDLGLEARGDSETIVVRSTSATDALTAVQAAQTFGVANGIEHFSRIVVAQRNGLAFGGVFGGSVEVEGKPAMAALSQGAQRWIASARHKELGAAARAALRQYDEAIVAYAGVGRDVRQGAPYLQAALHALAELDAAAAYGRAQPTVLPFLSSALFAYLDDDSPEHWIAQAVCSVGKKERRLRFHIAPVAVDSKFRLMYDASVKPVWYPDVRDTLFEILSRRTRAATSHQGDDNFEALFSGSARVGMATLGCALDFAFSWRKVKRLVRAYSIVDPGEAVQAQPPEHLPAAFAALRVLISGVGSETDQRFAKQFAARATHIDEETIEQLHLGYSARALAGAYRRLRSSGVTIRDFRAATVDPNAARTYGALLTVPISDAAYGDCLKLLKLQKDS